MASRAENVFKQGLPLNRRGERNVPKKYLKVALYTTAGEVQGYFVYYKGLFVPVEFDFTHCFWYIIKYDNQRSCSVSHKLPTEDYNSISQTPKSLTEVSGDPLTMGRATPIPVTMKITKVKVNQRA